MKVKAHISGNFSKNNRKQQNQSNNLVPVCVCLFSASRRRTQNQR